MATGHVYVIETEGGPVKIGVAINPSERLKQLQTGAWIGLMRAWAKAPEKDRIPEEWTSRLNTPSGE